MEGWIGLFHVPVTSPAQAPGACRVTPWLLLGVAVLLIAGNAVFVASETALVTVERTEVEAAAARGDARASRLRSALSRLSTQLSAAQLGITVTSLAIGLVAEPSIAALLHGPLSAVGLPEGATEPVAVALGLLLASVVQMVLGELVPKNLALARPFATAQGVLGVQLTFAALARPLVAVLNGTANRLLRSIGVEPTEELRSARTPDELVLVLRQSAVRGSLGTETARLLVRSLSFGDKRASDVMTPRVQVRFIAADAPVADVIAAARETGHSRFPLIGDGPDDVVGLVHVKQAVAVPLERRGSVPVREVMVPPVRVPDSIELDPLLDVLQQRGLQMAVVVDEFGGTAGIVTFEDLVEELVGEVADESDTRTGATDRARRRRDGSWLLSGLLRPDEVTVLTEVYVPEGNYETLGGLVQTALGRIPRVGDSVELTGGARLRVQRMDGRRVDRVVLVPPAAHPVEDER
jgi:CBS domain containing-hemolysin-like protein